MLSVFNRIEKNREQGTNLHGLKRAARTQKSWNVAVIRCRGHNEFFQVLKMPQKAGLTKNSSYFIFVQLKLKLISIVGLYNKFPFGKNGLISIVPLRN